MLNTECEEKAKQIFEMYEVAAKTAILKEHIRNEKIVYILNGLENAAALGRNSLLEHFNARGNHDELVEFAETLAQLDDAKISFLNKLGFECIFKVRNCNKCLHDVVIPDKKTTATNLLIQELQVTFNIKEVDITSIPVGADYRAVICDIIALMRKAAQNKRNSLRGILVLDGYNTDSLNVFMQRITQDCATKLEELGLHVIYSSLPQTPVKFNIPYDVRFPIK